MRLYIPPKDSELTLLSDWTFPLYNEQRNSSLYEAMDVRWPASASYWDRTNQSEDVTLIAGTKLKLDRIYIRSGHSDFDSITFFIPTAEVERLAKLGAWKRHRGGSIRFWVKLENANSLDYDPDTIVSPAQREVGKTLQKLLSKKSATVAALATTAEGVLNIMAKDIDSLSFNAISFDSVHLEHLATALRSSYTHKEDIPGWHRALRWCEQRCSEVGIDANAMLYGMLDS